MFGFDFDKNHFETFSHENGFTYWLASDLMTFLGYGSIASFQKAINKAIGACNTLNIPIFENFIQTTTLLDKTHYDFKLSRFACYLAVMNSDNKKPMVAMAQGYFASIAGALNDYWQEANNVERIIIREEVTEREKSLSGTAKGAGLQNYPFFQNAGYRGLYNKNISQLKEMRNVKKDASLLDHMGKEELAANLFRITQTELKIKNENIRGQNKLEVAAEKTGQMVRKTMFEISGTRPEDLPTHQDIKTVKKQLKEKNTRLKKIDAKKTK